MSNKLDYKIVECYDKKKKEINDNYYLKDWQIDKCDWQIFVEYLAFFVLIYKIIIIFIFLII